MNKCVDGSNRIKDKYSIPLNMPYAFDGEFVRNVDLIFNRFGSSQMGKDGKMINSNRYILVMDSETQQGYTRETEFLNYNYIVRKLCCIDTKGEYRLIPNIYDKTVLRQCIIVQQNGEDVLVHNRTSSEGYSVNEYLNGDTEWLVVLKIADYCLIKRVKKYDNGFRYCVSQRDVSGLKLLISRSTKLVKNGRAELINIIDRRLTQKGYDKNIIEYFLRRYPVTYECTKLLEDLSTDFHLSLIREKSNETQNFVTKIIHRYNCGLGLVYKIIHPIADMWEDLTFSEEGDMPYEVVGKTITETPVDLTQTIMKDLDSFVPLKEELAPDTYVAKDVKAVLPYFDSHYVAYENTGDNVRKALLGRQALAYKPIDTAVFNEFKRFASKWVKQYSPVKEIEPYEKWINDHKGRWSTGKINSMNDARNKTIADGGLCMTALRDRSVMCKTNELCNAETMKCPRCITIPDEQVTAEYGRIFSSIKQSVMNSIKEDDTPEKMTLGCNRGSVGKMFHDYINYSDADICFENDYSKFDSSISPQIMEVEHIIFDWLLSLHEVEKKKVKDLIDANQGWWYYNVNIRHTGEELAYKIKGTRRSGDPHTSISNTLLNMCMNAFCLQRAKDKIDKTFDGTSLLDHHFSVIDKHVVLCSGDDSFGALSVASVCSREERAAICDILSKEFETTTLKLGISSKFKAVPGLKYTEVEYCSSFFANVGDGFLSTDSSEDKYVLHGKIGRIISKTPLTVKNYSDDVAYATLAIEKLNGLMSELRYVPALHHAYGTLQVFYKERYKTYTKYMKNNDIVNMNMSKYKPMRFKYAGIHDYEVASRTPKDILDRYGVTEDELVILGKQIIQCGTNVMELQSEIADRIINVDTDRFHDASRISKSTVTISDLVELDFEKEPEEEVVQVPTGNIVVPVVSELLEEDATIVQEMADNNWDLEVIDVLESEDLRNLSRNYQELADNVFCSDLDDVFSVRNVK
jgi:hypothetical protein